MVYWQKLLHEPIILLHSLLHLAMLSDLREVIISGDVGIVIYV